MTKSGVQKLVGYQRAFYQSAWKHAMTEDELAEVYMAYASAFDGFGDQEVLQIYVKRVKGWKKMPSVAEILEAVMIEHDKHTDHSRYKCAACHLPWNNGHGYGREDPKHRGEIRCPECNAILQKPLPPDGYQRADGVAF